jgi:teichuronic acid biosynthesis glycosyltransferase TuaC
VRTQNDTLHVLTLTPYYPSESDDAEGCFVSEPLDRLAKTGVHITLLAVRPVYRRKPWSGGCAVPGKWVRYFSLPGDLGLSIAGAFLFARVVGQLRELHRTRRIDLLHAHDPLPCGHAAMLLGSELNIPYVVSVYGLDDLSPTQSSGRMEKWSRRIAQRVFASSRRVVCVNEHVREAVLERMGQSCRTSVVYNGVDTELFSPAFEPSKPTTTVLSAGNLTAIEGHDVLIRAIAILIREFPSVSLEVVGDGPERSRLEKLAKKLGLAGMVRLVGRQPRRQIADAMKRCTLFVLPSQSERSGDLHVRAMSCGKAVIGCRGQGIAEIIQHGTNGFLVAPGNEKELALAMGMLLRGPQRRQNLGLAARNSILDRLTVERQVENLRRVYRESVA